MPESSRAHPYAQPPGFTVAPSSGLSRKPKGGLFAGAPATGVPLEADAAEVPEAGGGAPPFACSLFWQARSPARIAAAPIAVVDFQNAFKFHLLA
jgi:hypothetical protein